MEKYKVLDGYQGDLKGGVEARIYDDGAVRNEKGYMLEPLPGGGIQSSDQARAMIETRWQEVRENAKEGVRRAIAKNKQIDIHTLKPGEELIYLFEHLTDLLISSKNSRGVAELLKPVLQVAYAIGKEEEPPQPQVSVFAPGAAAELLDKIREMTVQREKREIVDVT